MGSPSNNLLLRLHKWAVRQDENFLTEAFAHLLQHLLDHEPEAAVGILEALTGGFFRLRSQEAGLVVVRTQIVLSEGTPDLEIRTPEQLAYVEVKSASEASGEQVRRYRGLLRASGIPSTWLVLLTRYPPALGEEGVQPDFVARWYQVAEWLSQQRGRYVFNAVSAYLVEQFLSFLEARNMTMGQVTWEMPGGVRALRTLTDMLCEVATFCGVRPQPWGSRYLIGVYLDKPNYWIGIDYDRPEVLYFRTWNRKVDPGAVERLGVGKVFELTSEPGLGWKRELVLDAEDVHFFALSKASQLQALENFLKECLQMVKQVEIPDKGEVPTPGPSEEDAESTNPTQPQ
jgi:hypothetical protein